MTVLETLRTMDRRLRVMLIATALLLIPQIGEFVSIRDINTNGKQSALALLFMFAGVFIVPTSLILTAAILFTVKKSWREHQRLFILGIINILIIISVTWFFVGQCSWATVFGLALRSCH